MGFVGDLFTGNRKQQAANIIQTDTIQDAPVQGALQGNIDQSQAQINQAQNMLLAQAQGQGPNPALAQLQQTQDANARQSAGLIASQKGINPALAARLGGQMQVQATGQAAGQAATLAAQQQMAAQQQYGQQALSQQDLFQRALAQQNANKMATQQLRTQAQIAKSQGMMGGAESLGKGITGLGNSIGQAAMMLAHGGEVPGHAEVSGDSPANDKVPAMLSPGEIVVPRSHSDTPDHAKAFIDALMKSKEQDEPTGFAKIVKKHKELEKRIKKLEGKE